MTCCLSANYPAACCTWRQPKRQSAAIAAAAAADDSPARQQADAAPPPCEQQEERDAAAESLLERQQAAAQGPAADGDAVGQQGGGQQHHRLLQWPRWQLPTVPWGLNTTITLMAVWALSFIFAAYTLVPALLRLAGVSGAGAGAPAADAAWAQALRHLVLDALQVGALQWQLHGEAAARAPRGLLFLRCQPLQQRCKPAPRPLFPPLPRPRRSAPRCCCCGAASRATARGGWACLRRRCVRCGAGCRRWRRARRASPPSTGRTSAWWL